MEKIENNIPLLIQTYKKLIPSIKLILWDRNSKTIKYSERLTKDGSGESTGETELSSNPAMHKKVLALIKKENKKELLIKEKNLLLGYQSELKQILDLAHDNSRVQDNKVIDDKQFQRYKLKYLEAVESFADGSTDEDNLKITAKYQELQKITLENYNKIELFRKGTEKYINDIFEINLIENEEAGEVDEAGAEKDPVVPGVRKINKLKKILGTEILSLTYKEIKELF